jgi:transcriptional regulator with AAA-type ATPase domain
MPASPPPLNILLEDLQRLVGRLEQHVQSSQEEWRVWISVAGTRLSLPLDFGTALKKVERALLLAALKKHGSNRLLARHSLKLSHSTFFRLLDVHGLRNPKKVAAELRRIDVSRTRVKP